MKKKLREVKKKLRDVKKKLREVKKNVREIKEHYAGSDPSRAIVQYLIRINFRADKFSDLIFI